VVKTVLLMWKIRWLYFVGVAPNKLHGMYVTQKTPYRYPNACLALFAKAPVFGKVKTRMEGVLGKEGALSLHRALIHYVFGNLNAAALCPITLWVATDGVENNSKALHDDLFLSICNISDINEQDGEDLGRRMAFAATQALAKNDYVVLVGADCASVDAAYLESALLALESGESIVIGPAEDGGYVLLGLRGVPECLFADIEWGASTVLEATRQNLRNAGLKWIELEPRWDVDRPEDLARLSTLQPPFPKLMGA
jgi:hypothetical protein